jgi:hypothetical protein
LIIFIIKLKFKWLATSTEELDAPEGSALLHHAADELDLSTGGFHLARHPYL